MGKIKRTKTANVKQILANTELFYSIGAQVSGTGLIKAGTPVGGATSVLEDSKAVLTVVSDDTVQGVLLHDVDPTVDTNATLLIFGFVNEYRLDSEVVIPDAVKEALAGKVTFMKRNK